MYSNTRLDGIHPWVLKEQADGIAKMIRNMENCGDWGKFPEWKKRANVMFIFNKGEKEYLGNCKSVSCTSIRVNIIENNFLELISKDARQI